MMFDNPNVDLWLIKDTKIRIRDENNKAFLLSRVLRLLFQIMPNVLKLILILANKISLITKVDF